ncbi:FhaA domain-containing protein [Labedella endophytica]|uniref:DUF2662 domain-containing protein n=1 Tax=Labedella endophytica TaxID=1523160 RepID=A0A433JNT9_9MICO|nr:DUF3662 and FHA domain-containing protein [Labedella endophytica]RUQ98038.1 DUF2662 domain-containing protein [Labedella endophytica]
MGILDNFEKGLDRAVNGAFAKAFRSGLQPVEITSALKREIDTKAAVVSRERILAPNSFRVLMSMTDHRRMTAIGPALIDELTALVQKHASSQGYQFAGGISIVLEAEPSLSDGMLRVDSQNTKSRVAWTPVLDIGGKRYPITQARTVIGRGRDADITVEDTGTSRRHVEILWDGQRAQARDLGSTNGSTMAGERFSQVALPPDSAIQIGRTAIVFRVLAQAEPTAPLRRMDDATARHDASRSDGFWGPTA